jgi:hypothetical protein
MTSHYEKCKKHIIKYRQNNKHKINERRRQYYADNREMMKEKNRYRKYRCDTILYIRNLFIEPDDYSF